MFLKNKSAPILSILVGDKFNFIQILLVLLILVSNEASALNRGARTRVYELRDHYDIYDVQAEVEFGKNMSAKVLGKYELEIGTPRQIYLAKVGSSMVANLGRPEIKYYFGILKEKAPNAFALPGGFIFLTQGLMDIIQNEAELAGVLAHEIAHVNERHVARALKIRGSQSEMMKTLGVIAGGTTNSFRVVMQKLVNAAEKLVFKKGLKKSQEYASDRYAIESLYALNYSPDAYQNLLKRLEEKTQSQNRGSFEKTHPPLKKRIARNDRFLKKRFLKRKVSLPDRINVRRWTRNTNVAKSSLPLTSPVNDQFLNRDIGPPVLPNLPKNKKQFPRNKLIKPKQGRAL